MVFHCQSLGVIISLPLQATTSIDVELTLEVTREKRPEETLNLFVQGQ